MLLAINAINMETQAAKPLAIVGEFAALSILYFLGLVVYRLYIHPLHKIPGPWLNAVSRIPFARHLYKGTTGQNVLDLHRKYGEAVRLSPNEVSFISGETAWQDIYGFRTGKMKGQLNMQKDPGWYIHPPNGTHMVLANDEDHTRMRRTWAHAFSEKALANQEVLLQQYVDLLVSQLKEVSSSNKIQELSKWYNWTTFDIVADLTFGEPFGCLRDLRSHEYINGVFNSLKSFRLAYIMYWYPWIKRLRNLLPADTASLAKRAQLYGWVKERTVERMNTDTERPDFMTEVLKHNGDKGVELSPQEVSNNAVVLLSAGSETTATLLSGVTYLLLKNPAVMQKLKDEIRGKWQTLDDITVDAANHTPYLVAVLSEALRYFPPAPTGFERIVGKGGAMVSGYHLPEGTGVGVSSLPLGRSELYFKDPESFIPERWMGAPEYVNDKRDIVQPFNYGPRNCLGKNLAYAEMRLILAKMIWSFDMELDKSCENWMEECKVMTVWIKPPLWVHVKEVVRE